MQFTANAPINWSPLAATVPSAPTSVPPTMCSPSLSMPPSMLSPVSPVIPTQVDPNIKSQVISPDPCTSQTATHWELLHNLSTGRQSAYQHLKRRNDSSDEELEDELRTTPVKQHISEDKVSAIFNRLHITNNNSLRYEDDIESAELDDSTCEADENRSKNSMVFADELQSVIKSKTLTEKVIQNELDKYSKAVVLWQPPNAILSVGLSTQSEPSADSETSNDANDDNNDNPCDLDIDYMIEEVFDGDNDMEL